MCTQSSSPAQYPAGSSLNTKDDCQPPKPSAGHLNGLFRRVHSALISHSISKAGSTKKKNRLPIGRHKKTTLRQKVQVERKHPSVVIVSRSEECNILPSVCTFTAARWKLEGRPSSSRMEKVKVRLLLLYDNNHYRLRYHNTCTRGASIRRKKKKHPRKEERERTDGEYSEGGRRECVI